MTDTDIEATRAPLIDHLIELRSRLVKAIVVFIVIFIVCFFFAKNIYNILFIALRAGGGSGRQLIYTSPQEYFFTQVRVAIFTAAFVTCPVILTRFTSSSRRASTRRSGSAYAAIFSPRRFFFAARRPCWSILSSLPNLLSFFIDDAAGSRAEEQSRRSSCLPSVSEYLSLMMTLIFGFRPRLPVAGGADLARQRRPRRRSASEAGSGAMPLCWSSSPPPS